MAKAAGTVKLRTALDSKVTVAKKGTAYSIALHLGNGGRSLDIGEYELLQTVGPTLKQLPIYIEDFVTAELAIVKIQYVPAAVKLDLKAVDTELEGQRVQVQATPVAQDQLLARTAPTAKDVGPGYVAEGSEKVTEHSSASEVDKVMSSVASAEGGFASVEGSDLGIFTWGQGQWTVGANLLQPVLQFIKDERQDLFDRYWGTAGLDVRGNVLHYEQKPYQGKAKLTELFRSSKERNLFWVNIFAQAGQDPQIQRLQREYQRGEVKEHLGTSIGGKTPDAWLDTRGKAFYYSMWVNAPAYADSFFKEASGKAGAGKEATDAIRQEISKEFENLFKDSSITARDGTKHHYIAFWGERGRQKAIDECDKYIADPSLDKTWSTDQWTKHKNAMEKRESRYQKTKADIDKALSGQNVESDVPPGVGIEGD
jgi:hypothetical protein